MHLDTDQFHNLERLLHKRRRAVRLLRAAKNKTRGRNDLSLADKLARFEPHSEAIRHHNAEIYAALRRAA